MKLTLVRHGESTANRDGICQGHLDTELSDTGRNEAAKVGEWLKSEKFDAIYSSDLKRAKDTCNAIAMHHDTTVQLAQEIRERCKGEMQGKPKKAAYNWYLKNDIYTVPPPGGESVVEMEARVLAFKHKLLSNHMGESVLMVSHGEPIMAMLLDSMGVPKERRREFNPRNTAVSVIYFDRFGQGTVRILNSTDHLD